jgi:hypothetical protein
MTYAVNPIIKYHKSYSGNPAILGEFFDTAIGKDINSLRHRNEILAYYMEPISRQINDPLIKFLELKKRWEEETAILSSITEISMHPAYQQIIGMGQTAVPYILSELIKKPGHWFWALKSITGEDPVLQEQRGRLKEMTGAWLKWGKGKGYIG